MICIVRNRDAVEAQSLYFDAPHALISISGEGDPARLQDNPFRKSLLRLEFADFDRQPTNEKHKLFSRKEAKKILDFMQGLRDLEYTVVHCDAGISRSPAVAAAITRITGGNDRAFFKSYIPNSRVYGMLLTEYYERIESLADTFRKLKRWWF